MQLLEVYSVEDVRKSMQAFVSEHGGRTLAARALGVDPALVSRFMINKKSLPTPTLLKALGYEGKRVYVFAKVTK